MSDEPRRVWWREMVVYQIYWRSFQDSDGDGFGDLRGVIERLDYVRDLGVDMIWLNPFYGSPDVDNGYDISDYYSIMDKAGDWEDFRALIAACRERGLKVMLDLVLNHTSDQHAWFQNALDPEHPHHDYYIWRSGRGGEPPSNVRSWCEPSCWTYRPEVDAYYLHSFTRQQPDLNWSNPALRAELYKIIKFWAAQGVSGFRLDVINLIGKPEVFEPVSDPESRAHLANHPATHDYLAELRAEAFQDPELCTVGETPCVTPEDAVRYTGVDDSADRAQPHRGKLDMVIHFDHMDRLPTWSLSEYQSLQERWSEAIHQGGWITQYLNNHDQPRSVSRFGDPGRWRVESAKLWATLTHFASGTPFIYQGEELGMTNCAFEGIEEYRDVFLTNEYHERVARGEPPAEALAAIDPWSRDHARTPMQWSAEPNAGFSSAEPWIKVNPNYREINAESDLKRPDSIYRYYQRLIALRKTHPILVYGDYLDHDYPSEALYVFERRLDTQRWITLANTSGEPMIYRGAELAKRGDERGDELMSARLILGNDLERERDDHGLDLRSELQLAPYEVIVCELQSSPE